MKIEYTLDWVSSGAERWHFLAVCQHSEEQLDVRSILWFHLAPVWPSECVWVAGFKLFYIQADSVTPFDPSYSDGF